MIAFFAIGTTISPFGLGSGKISIEQKKQCDFFLIFFFRFVATPTQREKWCRFKKIKKNASYAHSKHSKSAK